MIIAILCKLVFLFSPNSRKTEKHLKKSCFPSPPHPGRILCWIFRININFQQIYYTIPSFTHSPTHWRTQAHPRWLRWLSYVRECWVCCATIRYDCDRADWLPDWPDPDERRRRGKWRSFFRKFINCKWMRKKLYNKLMSRVANVYHYKDAESECEPFSILVFVFPSIHSQHKIIKIHTNALQMAEDEKLSYSHETLYIRVQILLVWKFVEDKWGENIPSTAVAWYRYNITRSQIGMHSNCSFEWLCRYPARHFPPWPLLLLLEAPLIPSNNYFNYMQLIMEI